MAFVYHTEQKKIVSFEADNHAPGVPKDLSDPGVHKLILPRRTELGLLQKPIILDLTEEEASQISSGAPLSTVLTTLNARARQASNKGLSLREVDLSGADLAGVKLAGADMTGAALEKTNLERASLGLAQLDSANLKNAHLKKAFMEGASLRAAHLQRASFEGASLSGADLGYANVKETVFTSARLGDTSILNVKNAHWPWIPEFKNGFLETLHNAVTALSFEDLQQADKEGVDYVASYALLTKMIPDPAQRETLLDHAGNAQTALYLSGLASGETNALFSLNRSTPRDAEELPSWKDFILENHVIAPYVRATAWLRANNETFADENACLKKKIAALEALKEGAAPNAGAAFSQVGGRAPSNGAQATASTATPKKPGRAP